MEQCRNLKDVDSKEFQSFLNSFDDVFVDCDGVVFLFYVPIPGVKESIEDLKNANKNVYYVSNNCTIKLSAFHQMLTKLGHNLDKDHILVPTLAIISHFQSIDFKSKVYVIGMESFRQHLIEAGFDVAPRGPIEIADGLTTVELLRKELVDDPSVGAVIVDNDVNVNFIRLSKAIMYLKRPECEFIIAASDPRIPMGNGNAMLGAGAFQTIIKDMTGREPVAYGKPSIHFYEFIKKKLNVEHPERTLFVGDSLNQDMEFATKCGFKKLLVLTGNTKPEDLANVTDANQMPDYYLDSLGDLSELIKKHSFSTTKTSKY